VTIANAVYREGVAFSPDGAMYVTPTGTASITGGTANFDAGSVTVPSITLGGDTTTGWYRSAANNWTWAVSSVPNFTIATNQLRLPNGGSLNWTSSNDSTATVDNSIARVGANQLRYSQSVGSLAVSRAEITKNVTAIANNVATDVLTVTIPNAAHSGSIHLRVTCSLGAGGAIGANEATATNSYVIPITRTAGVATVTAISAVFGASAVAVAGAATVTGVATVTAMTGLVSATQTFTVQVTVVRSGGSSDNHTCLVYAQLMNANATGITLS
jgi:hypothetical protein